VRTLVMHAGDNRQHWLSNRTNRMDRSRNRYIYLYTLLRYFCSLF